MPDLFLVLVLPAVVIGSAIYLIRQYLRRELDAGERRIRQLGEDFRHRP